MDGRQSHVVRPHRSRSARTATARALGRAQRCRVAPPHGAEEARALMVGSQGCTPPVTARWCMRRAAAAKRAAPQVACMQCIWQAARGLTL